MNRFAVRRAVWTCLPFSGAIFLQQFLLPETVIPWGALMCVFLGAVGVFLRGKAGLCLRLAALSAAVGLLISWGQTRFVKLPAEKWVGERKIVTARVTDWPDIYDDSEYVTVRLTGKDIPSVRCRLVSYYSGELSDLVPGDEIRAEMRFLSASVRNGQEVDIYSAQGVFLRAVCSEEPERVGRWRFSFLYAPRWVSHQVVLAVARLFPSDAAPFMTALLTGEKGPLYQDGGRYYHLTEAGIAHVVAVSGMHISFLMGFLFLLLGRRRGAVIVALPLLLLFSAMTGFTPSVTRAAFMQTCVLSAPLFRREDDPITSLSVVLALILLLNPSAAASVSLQLSFASMAGIWLVSGRMYRYFSDRIGDSRAGGSRFIRRILLLAGGSVSSSVGAQIFSLPLCAVHFGFVSVVSPLCNILCLWMVSVLYIGGYIVLGLGALFSPVGLLGGSALAWGVRYIYAVTGLLRRIPCAAVYMSNPLFVLWVVFVYILLAAAWLMGRRGNGFRPILPLSMAVIGLYASAFAVELGWDENLRITALDVGQGESIVLTSGPRTVMVDCGGSYVTHDAGEEAVHFLGGQQRDRLDALILTHLHSDHVNGVPRLLAQRKVDTLYMPLEEDQDGYLPEILAAADAAGTQVVFVMDNLTLQAGDLTCTIFAPLMEGKENENCMIVLAAQDDFEVLITGDCPSEAEELLVGSYTLPDIEVLVAGHHGSRTSTCRHLLEAVQPDVAVISVGYNTYGHPSEAVLARLAEYNITVLRTDLDGQITLKAGKE